MQPAGTFPLGGRANSGGYVYDVDRDGHLDLVVNVYDGLGPLVIRGLGDGTFAEREKPPAIEAAFGSASLVLPRIYDGSGQRKFLISQGNVLPIIAEDFSASSIGTFLAYETNVNIYGVADVNGDGITDYILGFWGDSTRTLMVSVP